VSKIFQLKEKVTHLNVAGHFNRLGIKKSQRWEGKAPGKNFFALKIKKRIKKIFTGIHLGLAWVGRWL